MTHPAALRVFLDCEFTDLHQPRLLSVGMVSERDERLYLELDLTSPEGRLALAQCCDFVHDQVLEFFGLDPAARVGSLRALGQKAAAWLLGLGAATIELVHDYPADFELLAAQLRQQGDWPALQARLRLHDVAQACDCIDAENAADACYAQLRRVGLYRHHALADALALQAAFAAAFEEDEH